MRNRSFEDRLSTGIAEVLEEAVGEKNMSLAI